MLALFPRTLCYNTKVLDLNKQTGVLTLKSIDGPFSNLTLSKEENALCNALLKIGHDAGPRTLMDCFYRDGITLEEFKKSIKDAYENGTFYDIIDSDGLKSFNNYNGFFIVYPKYKILYNLDFEIYVNLPTRLTFPEYKEFYLDHKKEIDEELIKGAKEMYGQCFGFYKCDAICITRDHRAIYYFGRKEINIDGQ